MSAMFASKYERMVPRPPSSRRRGRTAHASGQHAGDHVLAEVDVVLRRLQRLLERAALEDVDAHRGEAGARAVPPRRTSGGWASRGPPAVQRRLLDEAQTRPLALVFMMPNAEACSAGTAFIATVTAAFASRCALSISSSFIR